MHRSSLLLLTRLGFAARGLMYVVIGWLALKAGRAEDGAGALEYLSGGAGQLLLAVMAVGFLFYGLWRLANALLDGDGHGSDGKALAIRGGGALSGIVHLGLFYYAARLALGDGGGGGDSTKEGTATALSLPGGWTLVMLAAACLLVVGGYQLIKAAKASFLKHLDGQASSAAWVKLAGRIGYAARGFVFLIVAWFLARAGLEEKASEAGGMDDALASLPGTFQLITAFGLMLFGLFSLVEARHRRISDPASKLERNGMLG